MKRSRKLLFLAICCFCLCFVLLSCTQPENDENPTVPSDHVLDATALKDGRFAVTATNKVRLEHMESDTVYLIRNQENLSPRSAGKAATVNKSLIDIEGDFLTVPNADGVVEFTGSDIGITGSGFFDIFPIKDGGRDDLTIKEDGNIFFYINRDGEKVYMEVYHIDFTKEPYSKLDRKRLFLDTEWTGRIRGTSVGYISVGKGGLLKKGVGLGLGDFSGMDYVNFFTRLKVDNDKPEEPRTLRFIFGNPTECRVDSAGTAITETTWTYSIPVPADTEQEYVLSIEKKPNVYYDTKLVRTLNGQSVEMIPVRDDRNHQDYVIGKIKDELIFDLAVSVNDANLQDYGKIVIRPINQDDLDITEANTILVDNKKVVKEYDIPDGKLNNRVVLFKSGNDMTLENLHVKVEYLTEDGKSYIDPDLPYTRYKFGRTSGAGMARSGCLGSYFAFDVEESYLLDNITLNLNYNKPVKVRFTIEKSDTPIARNENVTLYVLPENGKDVMTVSLERNGLYTVPELKKEGMIFKGLRYGDKIYKAGDSFEVKYYFSNAIAIWNEELK